MRRTSRRFRIDLHVHTGRYSQCAETVDPYRIEEHALRAGVDAVVICEHDVLWQEEEIDLLRASCTRIKIFRGIEVTARGCHLLVIGIDEAGPLVRGMPLEEVVGHARGHGAAVVLAHPYRDGDPDLLPVHAVDAVEIGSTSFNAVEAMRSRELALNHGRPMVASSDAHALSLIGWAWTELPRTPADETELATAIRDGVGRPIVVRDFPT